MKNLLFIFFLFLFTTIPICSQVTLNVPGDYATIQEAIDAANNGDVVLVADGTYYENIYFRGKAITVASHFYTDGNESHIANTIIDASQPSHPDSGSAVYFNYGEDTTSVLCGFTLTGGNGTLHYYWGDRSGGGVVVELSGGKICHNIMENNVITNDSYANAGGIVADLSSSTRSHLIIENNVIRNNSVTGNAWTSGGGIAIYDWSYTAYLRIINNVVVNNTLTDPNAATGGGIEVVGGTDEFFVSGNYVKGNECISGLPYGGGIDFFDFTSSATNNLVVGNSADYGGGVSLDVTVLESSISILINSKRQPIRNKRFNTNQLVASKTLVAAYFANNTIVNNSANLEGGGINVWNYSPLFMNLIVWGNTAPVDSNISGTPDVQYSDVEGGYTGTGNIDLNPEFEANWEYYALLESSPCIDAGNPDPVYNDVEDPFNPGNALWPAWGNLTNDMGHCGGPASSWGQEWPIPVELISFSATTQNDKVNLYWTTATEINNLGFEIERKIIQSDFERNWVRIGFVEGYGTTTEIQNYSYTDDISKLQATSLSYRLKQMDFNGSFEYSEEALVNNPTPSTYSLQQNFPNPFNPVTIIKYSLPVKSQVTLVLYNTLGEMVKQLLNEEKEAGSYFVELKATGLTSGVYFYRLQAGNFVEAKKMLLMK